MPIGASQSKEKSNKRSKEELDNQDIKEKSFRSFYQVYISKGKAIV